MLATLLISSVLSVPPATTAGDAPSTRATPIKAASNTASTNTASPVAENEEPRPDLEIEQAAREFRIEVYNAFRTQREEYDARRALGDDLLKTWNRAGQPAPHREAVLAWFVEAKGHSLSGAPLVPFAALEELRQVIVRQRELAESEAADAKAEQEVKLPPPFVVDPAPAEGSKDSGEGFYKRVKALLNSKLGL